MTPHDGSLIDPSEMDDDAPPPSDADAPPNVTPIGEARKRKPKKWKAARGEVEFEMDVARRLVETFGDELRYATGIGWLVWTGTHWARDEVERTRELVKGIAGLLRNEAAALSDQDLWRLAQKIATSRGIASVLDIARSDPRVRIDPSTLDAQPHLLACENGTIDLRTGELHEHDRAHLLTRLAPTAYDREARSEDFDRLLVHLIPDDEVRAYAQRLAGYSLVGHTTEDVVVLVLGPPRCGKGTFLRAMKSALGPHYVEPDAATFCKPVRPPDPDKPRSDLVALVGRRVVAVPEGIAGRQIDAGLVKRLAGGDRMSVRDLREKSFSAEVTFTIWMIANDDELPAIEANDSALWERVRRIPVGSTVPEAERDRSFRERLGSPENRAAFLAWAVRGAVEWHEHGLGPAPAAVRDAAAELRRTMDPARQFIDAMLVFEAGETATKSEVREALEVWCEGSGCKAPSAKRFAAALRAAGELHGVKVGETTKRTGEKVRQAWRHVRLATDREREDREREAACRDVEGSRGDLPYESPCTSRGSLSGTEPLQASTSLHEPACSCPDCRETARRRAREQFGD